MMQPWCATGDRLRTVASAALSRSLHTIQAVPREVTGARVSARERAQGRIPAVVFSQEVSAQNGVVSRKQLITAEGRQIESVLKWVKSDLFCSTRFNLQIRAGSGSSVLLESGNVLPIKIHRDEETGKILNLVFVWADEGSELEVDVPVVFKGEEACPGLKKGGHLNKIRTTLKYRCPAERIPQKIKVDVSKLDIGDRILMQDIAVDPSLKLLSGNNTKPVCRILATETKKPRPVEA